jgi:transcriptional regulator with XRE-family HTH domain
MVKRRFLGKRTQETEMNSEKTNPEVSIAESLQDMGERLRILRLKQGLDLEIVCKKTNIPIKHLKSIESGDLESLPELVYVRGFVRRYAQELKQDVESFDLGCGSVAVKRSPKIGSTIQVGELFHKLKYPLYGFVVACVGSVMVYLNNQEFSTAPVQSVIETPVIQPSVVGNPVVSQSAQ